MLFKLMQIIDRNTVTAAVPRIKHICFTAGWSPVKRSREELQTLIWSRGFAFIPTRAPSRHCESASSSDQRWVIFRFMIHICSLLILHCLSGCLHLYLSSFPLMDLHVSNAVMEGWIWAEHLSSVLFAVGLSTAPGWLILHSAPQLRLRGKQLHLRFPLESGPCCHPQQSRRCL